MKLPLSWLKEYVDYDCSVEELMKKLFSCGFEVEEVVCLGENIDKIVTSKILKIENHPNADKLKIVQIDAGKYGNLQIVTAATNVFEGAIVPVALDGATLCDGNKIYNSKLRGVPSYGMFCSGEELGINDDWYEGAGTHGVLIFNENFPLGEEVKDLLQINDVIFDINVTANRPDCQSIIGLAREVSAVLNKPFKMPNLDYKTSDFTTTKEISVQNLAFDLCPRYSACLVKDIVIKKSPQWLRRRLFLMGIRSICNIVDITNYVLMEIGQPMHAFDLVDLSDKKILVRRAEEGEKIITLDEKEFALNSNNLVICDGQKPVALAGIMGGANSGIKDNTLSVVFESARFARDNVRKTSRLLGQRSDSSSRFEKGVDFYSVEVGLDRALSLIDQLNCGKIACDKYDLISSPINNKIIKTKISKINEVLGLEVSSSQIQSILTSLSFKVNVSDDDIIIEVPLYREDVEDYPDIAEEVIREYGYDNITSTLLKTSSITNGGRTVEQNRIEDIKKLLTGSGFNEIITYSFVPSKDYDIFEIEKNLDINPIKILNPISEDLAVMRTTLLPSIIKVVANNINRKNLEGRLFEIAKVYLTNQKVLEKLPEEKLRISLACFGVDESFYSLKGEIEQLLSIFCNGVNAKYVRSSEKVYHPTRSADIYVEGVKIGSFGQINPTILSKIDVDKSVYAGELYYDEIAKFINDKILFKPISKYPIIERDIALVVDDEIEYDKIVEIIKSNGGEYLDSVKLFDFYKGNQISSDKKSLAFNLVFVSLDRTLNVEEIDQSIKNILDKLNQELGAELR